MMSRHCSKWARAALAAACAPAFAVAQQAADADLPSLPPVTVTATPNPLERDLLPSTTESVTSMEMAEKINVMNVEDALRYMPSLIVRKRHFGDTQDPVATRTSGLGQSARSLVYGDGVLLSALIGNNNTFATPRWGMVTPEEISRIDVLYGPFAAAYPGNSMGAVIEMTTRRPREFEAGIDVSGAWQTFKLYGTNDNYGTYQVNAYVAGQSNGLGWWLSGNHLDSHSQPLGIATVTRPTNPSAAGTPIAGAYADQNRLGAPIAVLGATGFEHQVQDNAKVKLTYDFTSDVRLTYLLGYFQHDNNASAQSYITDAAGTPLYAGSFNFDGYNYVVAPSVFSNGVYRAEQEHLMQALSLRTSTGGQWDGEAIVSYYDYQKDLLRVPTVALPTGFNGGAGSITNMAGTGWANADAKGYWRPEGISGTHQVSFGVHYDLYKLESPRYNTLDWISGGQDVLAANSLGKTRTFAIWAQDVWRLDPRLRATLGGRYEWWKAYDGFNYSLVPPLDVEQPSVSVSRFSPKASLAWDVSENWLATASLGVANRFPTVTELYQAIATGPTLTVPNPNLKPEHALSGELAVERVLNKGRIRLSYFQENLNDALIAQTAPLVPGSTQLFNYVQNIDKIQSRGAELVAQKSDLFFEGFDLSGSVTFVNSRILEDPPNPAAVGKRTPNIPEWKWTVVATYRPTEQVAATIAARHSSRVWATIDNTDVYTHTYQGFDSFLVLDARVYYQIDPRVSAAIGVDNFANSRYYLFHPFPQQTWIAEIKVAL